MPPDRLRLFTALRLPIELQSAAMPDPEHVPGQWRWVKPDGLHVTLVFLGDVPAAELPELITALQALQRFPPIALRAEQLEGFPNRQRARVLVRHVPATPELLALQAESARLLAPWQGAEKHGHYHPHVTLARHKLGSSVPDLPLPALDWIAPQVALIESVRNSQGAHYVDRATIALGNDSCG